MKITEGKKSGKRLKCNTQKMEDVYIFIQKKKKKPRYEPSCSCEDESIWMISKLNFYPEIKASR